MEQTIEKLKLNVKEELEKINAKTIYEFQKTIDNFDIKKVKAYTAKDEERTICFLFYDNDFFAINRVNFKEGYEYTNENLGISENLNSKIRKIPNVAKTRKILNIEDIETRIYDMSEYIMLLNKETIRVIKVINEVNLEDIKHEEYKLDLDKLQEDIKQYKEIEEKRLAEEKSVKRTFKKISEKIKYIFVEPFKMLKSKIMKTNDIKMLSEGKHSIFDKED